jgi:hypothetical protein
MNVRHRFPFYVTHVVFPEVAALAYNQTAMKAFMALVQKFGWFRKTSRTVRHHKRHQQAVLPTRGEGQHPCLEHVAWGRVGQADRMA